MDVHVVNLHLCDLPELGKQNDNTIDMTSMMANVSKVTLHLEPSEMAVAVIMGPPHNCQASLVKT